MLILPTPQAALSSLYLLSFVHFANAMLLVLVGMAHGAREKWPQWPTMVSVVWAWPTMPVLEVGVCLGPSIPYWKWEGPSGWGVLCPFSFWPHLPHSHWVPFDHRGC